MVGTRLECPQKPSRESADACLVLADANESAYCTYMSKRDACREAKFTPRTSHPTLTPRLYLCLFNATLRQG